MTQQTTASIQQSPTVSDLVDHLTRFDGPPDKFLLHLLMVQCRLALADCGAIVRIGPDGKPEVLAVYPALDRADQPPVWLAHSVEATQRVMAAGSTVIAPLRSDEELYGTSPSQYLVHIPVRGGAGVRGSASFLIASGDPDVVNHGRERLELSISLLSLFEMRLTVARRKADMQRMRAAMEVLAAVNSHERFGAATMAMVNEISSRWQAERVSLGFLEGRYVKLRALSHTEKFTRQMKLVQDIESAMEECLDQDVEIIYPTPPEAPFVSRGSGQLSARHGPTTVCSLPMRVGPKVVGVLTMERPADQPFEVEQIETVRLTLDLCTARIYDLHEHDKWIGAKAADLVRKTAAKAVSPEHTWIKLLAIGIFGFILFVSFVKGADRVEAPFLIEATERQVVPAPYKGFLEKVFVDPGDKVEAGKTLLATLDASELRLRLASSKAERAGYEKKADLAMRDGKTAEVQMAQADADRVAADMRLLEYQIAQARIVSPVNGIVMTGDLRRRVGAPVEQGDVLFEVAPQKFNAELKVPDNRIADVTTRAAGPQGTAALTLSGMLATNSHPGEYIPFVVQRIDPVAQVIDQKNVFKARVELKETRPWLRTGMEGVAKIDVGRRPYAYLWTRDLVNWVRMKLWI